MKGLIFAVDEERTGATLTASASIGNTSITVDDPFVFDEDGGSVQFGKSGEVVTYSAVDDTTKVLTVSALTANHAIGDIVWAYPIATTRYAMIQAEGDEGDAVQAIVPHNLHRRLPTGTYDMPVPCDFSRLHDSLDLVVRRVTGRGGIAAPQPVNVLIYDSATDRIVIDWDAPEDPTDSKIPGQDAIDYQVELSTSSTFATTYKFDSIVRGTKKSWKVASGSTYYGRVRGLHPPTGMTSLWVPGKLTPNSDPTALADGVVIGAAGSGKTKVVWHVLGRLRVLTEAQTHDYDIDEGLTLTKIRVRVKNVALGQSVKITPYKNGSALTQITLPASTSRVANDSYATAFADADRLSFSVDQVGTTFPGKQLTVIAVFTPT